MQELPKSHWNLRGVLGICGLLLSVIVFISTTTMQNLSQVTSDLTDIHYLSSSTQRCVRMILLEKSDTQLIFYVGNETDKLLNANSKTKLFVLSDNKCVVLADIITDKWNYINEIINSKNPDYELLQVVLDEHFDSITQLSKEINIKADNLNKLILTLEFSAFLIVLFIIAIILMDIMQTIVEKQRNTMLAKFPTIDTATGLFNRNKCQELLKTTTPISNELKKPAIILIKLNDLKKTNDNLGNFIGDELILLFANLLKEACSVYEIKPFIGRYSGEEFLIFYKEVKDDSLLKLYVKELNLLTREFNKTEDIFKISFASGYAIPDSSTNNIKVKELYDIAAISIEKTQI